MASAVTRSTVDTNASEKFENLVEWTFSGKYYADKPVSIDKASVEVLNMTNAICRSSSTPNIPLAFSRDKEQTSLLQGWQEPSKRKILCVSIYRTM